MLTVIIVQWWYILWNTVCDFWSLYFMVGSPQETAKITSHFIRVNLIFCIILSREQDVLSHPEKLVRLKKKKYVSETRFKFAHINLYK